MWCDVCAEARAYQSVQSAINAALTTIRICPGTYAETGGSLGAITISSSVTLIGAGDGADDTTNSVLRPAVTNNPVVALDAGSGSEVRLEGLRITGGTGGFGPGVFVLDTPLTLKKCTVTENTPGMTAQGGGIFISAAPVTLLSTQVTVNSGGRSGGIYAGNDSVTLDALRRVTGNTGLNSS